MRNLTVATACSGRPQQCAQQRALQQYCSITCSMHMPNAHQPRLHQMLDSNRRSFSKVAAHICSSLQDQQGLLQLHSMHSLAQGVPKPASNPPLPVPQMAEQAKKWTNLANAGRVEVALSQALEVRHCLLALKELCMGYYRRCQHLAGCAMTASSLCHLRCVLLILLNTATSSTA